MLLAYRIPECVMVFVMVNIDLSDKVALVAGVQNEYSLGWAAAKKLLAAGCKCIFSFQGERNLPALQKLTAPYGEQILMLEVCDVMYDEQIDALFEKIKTQVGQLDFLMHAIAFTPRETQENPFVQTSREHWKIALDISAYSLLALAQRAVHVMREGSSIVSLTYYASEKVVPKYNVMGVAKAALEATTRYLAYDLGSKGIRVNAVSPGPMRTVAAKSIPGFTMMLEKTAKNSAMGKNASFEDVGNMCLFLFSPLSGATTGETIYVDGGYSMMGMAIS
jgi:enoyl-[acyl-carrier protein] reductase I